MNFSEFISFRKMITPTIIQIVFWIGVVGSVLAGLFSIVSGLSAFGGGAAVLTGLVMIIVGPVAVRVYCELIILAFRSYETLVQIRDGQNKGASAAASGQ